MSWRKAKSPGWASFDLKQRQQKDGSLFVDHLKEEEKPSLPPIPHKKKNHLTPSVRSFSSVLLPPPAMEFPTLANENNNNNNNNNIRDIKRPPSGSTVENDTLHACAKLKKLYGWADESLITDVLAAVDIDLSKASALLAEMVCPDSSEQKKDKTIEESMSDMFLLEHKCLETNEGTSSKDSADIKELNRDGSLNQVNGGLRYGNVSCKDEGSDKADALNMRALSLDNWKNVPAEPEWEEDDIYFIHRRKAVHMMRSASQHSKKAADAYISGDHFSAQQFSAKAREEWTASERLNAIAAKEILSIRNNGKDPWKLDLHGLHALEAVQALQEHLQKLEHLVPSDRSLSPDRRNGNKLAGNGIGIGRSSSVESLTCTKTGGTVNSDSKYCASSSPQQLKQTSLHVITGVGNHSRGEAALPSAVKNFLDENGYRYDDARPGLITVKPKFRGRRALAKMAA